MKKSPHYFNYVLAATGLAFLATSGAIAQTRRPSGLAVPAKTLPVPSTVSPQLQKVIGAPLRTNWISCPRPVRSGNRWRRRVRSRPSRTCPACSSG